MADEKLDSFIEIMRDYYKQNVEENYPYFEDHIMDGLDILEEMYICATAPELIHEVDVNDWVENKLFNLVNAMEKDIKKIMRNW